MADRQPEIAWITPVGALTLALVRSEATLPLVTLSDDPGNSRLSGWPKVLEA